MNKVDEIVNFMNTVLVFSGVVALSGCAGGSDHAAPQGSDDEDFAGETGGSDTDADDDTISLDIGDASDGAVPECTDPQWAVMETGYEVSFKDVWAAAPDDVWAVTGQDVLFHYDGVSWSVNEFDPGCPLEKIEGRSPSDIYLGGDKAGCLFHFDGVAWSQVSGLSGEGVKDMVLVDTGLFVTNRTNFSSAAYFFDGESWRVIYDESTQTGLQEAVAAVSPTNAYFIGQEKENC